MRENGYAICDACGRKNRILGGGTQGQYVGAVVKSWGINSEGKRVWGDFCRAHAEGHQFGIRLGRRTPPEPMEPKWQDDEYLPPWEWSL
jgi:hypothetical protein